MKDPEHAKLDAYCEQLHAAWIAAEDLMITVQTNSQPPDGTDKLGDAVGALYQIVKESKAE